MRSPASIVAPSTLGVDGRLITTMRLVLSSSILFIIGPSDIDNLGAFHALSALYIVYSALLYLFTWRYGHPKFFNLLYWGDLGWAALLTALSDDSSIAFLFLFPILLATSQWQFVPALRLTLVAAILLVSINLLRPLEDEINLPEILLPPVDLILFGCLVAFWGDREMAVKRRLVLLKEATRLSNPRFGTDRMIATTMERLRAFYNVEACLMIVTDPVSNTSLLRRADRCDPERALEPEPISAEAAKLLLSLPPEQAVIYLGMPRAWEWWRSAAANYHAFDAQSGFRVSTEPALNEALVTIVDAESFISAPLNYSDLSLGRIYLTASRRNAFSPMDVSFLLQVIEQIIPVIENLRLVDQLASNAAREERSRLARDIHDNVIQPYIGLQIGLAAVSQKLQSGASNVNQDIAKLMAVCEEQIGVLRRYIHQLPEPGERESSLLAAVRRFITTFSEATHITVEVEAASDLYINDRLAAEVFQMIAEGLSNIRRHTHATHARIELANQEDELMVQIANDDANGVVPERFIPRSISERAAALGGQAYVERVVGGGAQVMIRIPL